MKRIILLLLLLLSCDLGPIVRNPIVLLSAPECPTVNLPLTLRQGNWGNDGSCAWATMVSLLRWQAQYRTANWIRENCGGAGSPENMGPTFDRTGIRYAYTDSADEKFLEWACSTRRGCGISLPIGEKCQRCGNWHSFHMVALVYLDDKWAVLLDNNNVEKYIWVLREALIVKWKAMNGWAMTPVYSPAAPLP